MTRDQQVHYWKENLTYIVVLLSIWFSCSFLAGIVFANALDSIKSSYSDAYVRKITPSF